MKPLRLSQAAYPVVDHKMTALDAKLEAVAVGDGDPEHFDQVAKR